MSVDSQIVAALEAVAACERLAAQLPHLAAWLEHAASMARADWTGPHRDRFDERIAAVDRALVSAAATLHVLRARVDE
jgi:hypothetical protein